MPNYFRDPGTGEVMYDNGDGTASPMGGFNRMMVPGAGAPNTADPMPEPEPDILTDDTGPDDVLPVQPEYDGPAEVKVKTSPDDVLLDEMMADAPGDEPGEIGGGPYGPGAMTTDKDQPIDPYGPPTLMERKKSLLHEQGERAIVRAKQREDLLKQEADRKQKEAVGYFDMVQRNLAKAQHDAQVLDGHIAEFRQMRVDPKKYFKDAGSLGTAMMALGVALGGFDAPFHGGKNPVLDIINRGVEREMKAQMANIGNAKTALGMEMNLLQMNRRRYQDEQLAQIQTRRMLHDAFVAKFRAAMADQPEDVRLKNRATELKLEAETEALKGKAGQLMFDRHMKLEELKLKQQDRRIKSLELGEKMRANRAKDLLERYKLALRHRGSGGDPELKKLKKELSLLKAKKGIRDLSRDLTAGPKEGMQVYSESLRIGPGKSKSFIAYNQKDKENVHAIVTGTENFIDALWRAHDKFSGRAIKGSDERNQVNQFAAAALLELRRTLKGQGQISDYETKILEKFFPGDPSKIFRIESNDSIRQRFKNAIKLASRSAQSKLRGYEMRDDKGNRINPESIFFVPQRPVKEAKGAPKKRTEKEVAVDIGALRKREKEVFSKRAKLQKEIASLRSIKNKTPEQTKRFVQAKEEAKELLGKTSKLVRESHATKRTYSELLFGTRKPPSQSQVDGWLTDRAKEDEGSPTRKRAEKMLMRVRKWNQKYPGSYNLSPGLYN